MEQNNTMDKLKELEDLLATAKTDADKFYNKGNNAAGTRLRKAMQDIKSLATQIRANVTEKKKS